MNKPINLGLPRLEISQIAMHEFYYNYVKLCYMATDFFVVHVKTKDIDEDIAKRVEEKFDASNYDLEMQMKNDLGVKIYWTRS